MGVAEPIPRDEILAFLRAVEDGDVRLVPRTRHVALYSGSVRYDASNGWRIAVFVDAGEWDYVEEVVAADGRVATFDDFHADRELAAYRPSARRAWSRYRVPGHLHVRCWRCGVDLARTDVSAHRCARR